MTRSLCVLAALTLFSEFLVGCDSVRKSFGGGKNAPDEFVVYKRPPLSLPPEYGLRPPAPGESRPQKVSPMDQAREAILGKNAARTAASPTTVKAGSPGLQALITRTGANKAEPGIRRLVNQESSVLADEDQIFVNKLIFWVDDKSNPGIVVVIDRVLVGAVIDFLDFHWAGFHWPAFNVADIAITSGAAALIWDSFFGKHEDS